MMDYTESILESVGVHHVGNKTNEEELGIVERPAGYG